MIVGDPGWSERAVRGGRAGASLLGGRHHHAAQLGCERPGLRAAPPRRKRGPDARCRTRPRSRRRRGVPGRPTTRCSCALCPVSRPAPGRQHPRRARAGAHLRRRPRPVRHAPRCWPSSSGAGTRRSSSSTGATWWAASRGPGPQRPHPQDRHPRAPGGQPLADPPEPVPAAHRGSSSTRLTGTRRSSAPPPACARCCSARPTARAAAKLDQALRERDLLQVGWSVDPQEWKGGSEDQIVETSRAAWPAPRGRATLLLHDTQQEAVRALPRILDWIARENHRAARHGGTPLPHPRLQRFCRPARPCPRPASSRSGSALSAALAAPGGRAARRRVARRALS